MQKSDVQLGKPETLYKATKDEIEALTLPVAGMEAYATDTKVTGFYNGSNWMWNDWGRVVTFNDEIIVFQDDIVWTY